MRTGDTLARIANSFNASLAAILQQNPSITNPNNLFPGQVILIFPGELPILIILRFTYSMKLILFHICDFHFRGQLSALKIEASRSTHKIFLEA